MEIALDTNIVLSWDWWVYIYIIRSAISKHASCSHGSPRLYCQASLLALLEGPGMMAVGNRCFMVKGDKCESGERTEKEQLKNNREKYSRWWVKTQSCQFFSLDNSCAEILSHSPVQSESQLHGITCSHLISSILILYLFHAVAPRCHDKFCLYISVHESSRDSHWCRSHSVQKAIQQEATLNTSFQPI